MNLNEAAQLIHNSPEYFKYLEISKLFINYIDSLKDLSNLNKKIFINYDHVINLSGYIDHSKKIKTIKSHYYGLKNLVNFFKKKNIKTFMQIGSCLEYGNIRKQCQICLCYKPRS